MTATTTRVPPPPSWAHLPFFQDNYPRIEAALQAETRKILPPAAERFAALALTAPADTRVVILGQDPYPTPGHAHGLAFSAASHVRPLPRSLANIYKEMEADLGACPPDADLHFWARQGVLLLNTSLSVPAGAANAHAKLGWSTLTRQVLGALDDRPRAFLLWGRPAQAFIGCMSNEDHLILCSPHPSPLSAHRGFFGSRPFSKVNNWLTRRGEPPINWTDPGAPT